MCINSSYSYWETYIDNELELKKFEIFSKKTPWGATMPWKGIKPLRISKFYMQMCPSTNSIEYVVYILTKLLGQ